MFVEAVCGKYMLMHLSDISSGWLRTYSPLACSHTGGHMVANSGIYTTLLRNNGGRYWLIFLVQLLISRFVFHAKCRTGPEACNSSDPDANSHNTKWCGAVSRDVLLALTLPNPYSLLAFLASMLPGFWKSHYIPACAYFWFLSMHFIVQLALLSPKSVLFMLLASYFFWMLCGNHLDFFIDYSVLSVTASLLNFKNI